MIPKKSVIVPGNPTEPKVSEDPPRRPRPPSSRGTRKQRDPLPVQSLADLAGDADLAAQFEDLVDS